MIKNIEGVSGNIYCTCSACMSVLSDFLSWANANSNRIIKTPERADNIIVLSCQVTDLAIRNDLKIVNEMKKYNVPVYVGGCLAQRLDIELPEGVFRLDHTRQDKQFIEDKTLVNFEQPFWVKKLDEKNELNDGMLFRNMYPLRIGVGCSGNCTYCTIKHTRGKSYQLPSEELVDEFLCHDDVVLIADSPKKEQLLEWINISKKYNKPISIRNVEPPVTMSIFSELILLSKLKLLKIFHCPVQSSNLQILKSMNRDYKSTIDFINEIYKLKNNGTVVATNIIIDIDGFFETSDLNYQLNLLSDFDYVSWNPMWSGTYNQKLADVRHEYYFGN
jgi:ribosomal protein S12 methylthiotransferase